MRMPLSLCLCIIVVCISTILSVSHEDDVLFSIQSDEAFVKFQNRGEKGMNSWSVGVDSVSGLLEWKNEEKTLLIMEGGSLFSGSSIFLEKEGKQLHLRSTKKNKLKAKSHRETISNLERLTERVNFLGNLNSQGIVSTTASGDIKVNNVLQWKMIVHEDFHSGTVEGWKNTGDQSPIPPDNSVSTCSSPESTHVLSDYFLGGFANMMTSKVYALPDHSRVKIEARFHFIDAWEGESGYLKVDGKVVWSESHSWCDKIMKTICQPRGADESESTSLTIDVCGHPDFPDKLSVPISTTIEHTDNNIRISFGSNLASIIEGRDSVEWGVDDVRIYVL